MLQCVLRARKPAALGRCAVVQRAVGNHLLVHGAPLRGEDGGVHGSRDRRCRVKHGHPTRMDGGRPGIVGRVLNFWFLGCVSDRVRS